MEQTENVPVTKSLIVITIVGMAATLTELITVWNSSKMIGLQETLLFFGGGGALIATSIWFKTKNWYKFPIAGILIVLIICVLFCLYHYIRIMVNDPK
jgi:fatty acid desaturase